MAFIDSGPVDATDRFETTPKNKWPHLMRAKRSFLAVKINYDCRCLVEFVQEAEQVWQELGFDSSEDMIRNGYELDPVEIELAVAWLRHNDPNEAISLEDVRSKQIAEAKANPARDPKGGRPPKDEKVSNTNLSKGLCNDRILARLVRDGRDDLLDAIESGELSINAAAIKAGYRKKLSEAEKCVRAFRKAENRLEPLKVIVSELEDFEIEVLKDWLGGQP